MRDQDEETRVIRGRAGEEPISSREVLVRVYRALQEKGYNPMRQIAYYLLTGEPAYITAHDGARRLMASLERDEVIEELVRYYLTGQRDG